MQKVLYFLITEILRKLFENYLKIIDIKPIFRLSNDL